PYTNNRILVGTALGKIIRLNNANGTPTWTDISMPGQVGAVSDIRYGASENDIMVTFHNYGVTSVWYTANGGTSWVSKEGDLPDMPVKCILQNPLSPDEVIIGTELGVWQTSNWSAANPNWTQSQNGMSDVKVTSFDYRSADNTILASTYGRGMFTGTFEVAINDPQISFDLTSGTTTEGSECSYTDYDVTLSIAVGASANATVNFTVNGSSTATNNVDFELVTPSVTFPAGSTTAQTMTIRVYEDAAVETDETVIVDFTVNANGGDASANTSADTFTLTISNDDAAPSSNSNVTLFSEDFEGGSYAVTTSSNSATPWAVGNTASSSSTYWNTTGNTTNFAFTNDDACNCDKSNDRLTTNVIDMSGAYSSATLSFDHALADVSETGTVRVSTDGTTFTTINTLSNTSTANGGGSYTTPWVNNVTLDISSYIGQSTVYIQFLYNDGGTWAYGMAVDNILVTAAGTTGVQTAVNTGAPDQINIHGTGTSYATDPTTGDVMAAFVNNNSFDYGCVDVAVSRSGTSAQSYNGSTAPDLVTDKTFTVTPSNTTTAGNIDVTFYFEEAEIAGWEAATGLLRSALVIGRGNATTIDETSVISIGSFGTNVTLTGSFTGLNGTYYFGNSDAFIGCAGVVKTWNGATWIPAGIPDGTNPVVINGNYDTATNGNLNACNLTVNTGFTFTVDANTYAQIENGIVVDGTLIVAHQGNLVQVDDDALVVNNGTINVNLTTPNLASRDFMVLGSPMTADTRTGVWSSAFLVLNHDTSLFSPNPAVAAAFPGAENFADDNYDNWIAYSGGINPAEGYIVRPQSGYGQPGGVFNYTYDQGTLNNGVVNFNVIYNTPGPTPADNKNASPNIIANPYACAISADDFINANAMVDEIYFWEHLTPPSPSYPGAGSMNFDMQDISMYNLTGGTAAANDPGTSTEPNGIIATGQGFGIKANAAGTAIFNNSMRRTSGNTTLRQPNVEDRIWLTVYSKDYELQNTTLIGFSSNTTAGIDKGYDSRCLATVLALYSHLEDGSGQLGIQSREAFEDGIKIPMGFSTQILGDQEYEISIRDIEGGNLQNATVYIMDNYMGITVNLLDGPYSFKSIDGNFNGRFTLRFNTETVLNTKEALANIGVFPNPTQGLINIASPNLTIEKMVIYDIQGRKILEQAVQSNNAQIDLSHLNSAVYFVEITTEKGVVNKRIVRK
ncbi:MAG: T9SS type A sorting domain-containing protein, partial [Flavobacteriaceae bacterium]